MSTYLMMFRPEDFTDIRLFALRPSSAASALSWRIAQTDAQAKSALRSALGFRTQLRVFNPAHWHKGRRS